MDSATKLLDLATEKFGSITNAETKLFQAVANGELADYSAENEKDNDPAKAESWAPERVLKSDRIAWICTDNHVLELVTHHGIWVKGARVDGKLDLEFVRISFPLRFERTMFPDPINICNAEVRAVNLAGAHTGSIYGDGLVVVRDVFLRNGFKANGPVYLTGAIIGGNLECDGSQFINKGAVAIKADAARVAGSIFLRNGFKAMGEVRLLETIIGGQLDCGMAEFVNIGRRALSADGLTVKSIVRFDSGFKAEGEVRLLGAKISGMLNCIGGQFINPGGKAIAADGAEINTYVMLRNGFRAEGEVSLLNAKIGSSLACDGGEFINVGGRALNADKVNIAGDVFLRDGFKAEGMVSFVGAKINGGFVCANTAPSREFKLDFRSAKVGTFWDDEQSWPEKGNLFLHNFEYNEIDDKSVRDAKKRIEWVCRQYHEGCKEQFRSQPYEQLAAVLRKSGDDAGAKKILIAKNEDKARLTRLTWPEKIWYRLLGPIIGYGYRPLNALWWIILLIVFGCVLFGVGYLGGLITPQSESAYVQRDTKIVVPGDDERQLSDVYPRFHFLVYSVDVFVPLVDLHQAKYWLPNANRGPELLRIKGFSLHTGGVLRSYMWIHICLGWDTDNSSRCGPDGLGPHLSVALSRLL